MDLSGIVEKTSLFKIKCTILKVDQLFFEYVIILKSNKCKIA